jgi:coenzyme F420-reducing hydrogenase beta subunit
MASAKAEKTKDYKVQDEEIGVYSDLFSAKTKVEGQDGGVVSSLLIKGFEEGLFDAAIVVRRGFGYTAESAVVTNADEVLAVKGTKYLKVNVTKKLRELISQGKKRIAIVCTPCEAKAVRKIQQTFKNDYEITVIGLFCFEAFNSARIKEEVKTRLGVDLDRAQKTQVRKGKFSAFIDGIEYSCKVKDLEAAGEKVCSYCGDFSALNADVSVGSSGSQEGYSTVIVRSKVGEKLVKNFDAAKEVVNKQEIARLSKIKLEHSKKNLSALNKAK